MPSAVTHQSHIRSPDEVTASVRPLPTPLSWSPIDSTRNFGVKGNHRPDPPTARDRPFMQPAGNVTLSNQVGSQKFCASLTCLSHWLVCVDIRGLRCSGSLRPIGVA